MRATLLIYKQLSASTTPVFEKIVQTSLKLLSACAQPSNGDDSLMISARRTLDEGTLAIISLLDLNVEQTSGNEYGKSFLLKETTETELKNISGLKCGEINAA